MRRATWGTREKPSKVTRQGKTSKEMSRRKYASQSPRGSQETKQVWEQHADLGQWE